MVTRERFKQGMTRGKQYLDQVNITRTEVRGF